MKSLALCLLPLALQLNAAVIVGNAGAVLTATGVPGSPTHIGAAGFLSPTVATTITSVTATFATGSSAGEFPTLVMALYADAIGAPGALLANLGSTTMTTSAGNEVMTFTPGAGVALAASTNYFLGVTCPGCIPGTRQANWAMSDNVTLVGLPGASVTPGVLFSSNSGATYGQFVTDSFLIFALNDDSSGIPEPAPVGMVAVGMGLLALLRRKASRA